MTPMLFAEGYRDVTHSATAVPAFSMRVSEGTPKRSLVMRSISRISAAVTIFMAIISVVRWSCVVGPARQRGESFISLTASLQKAGPSTPLASLAPVAMTGLIAVESTPGH